MALILGWLGRTGSISWRIPTPANLALRNFGLTLFLAAVAIGAGKPFVDTVAAQGIPILLAGAAVLLTNVRPWSCSRDARAQDSVRLADRRDGRRDRHPAIPAYGARMLQSDRVDVGYATIFPSMTIVKVIVAQVATTPCSPQLLPSGCGECRRAFTHDALIADV